MQKTYVAIDLKSYYASVECADRNFDPLTTNLVVADESRTEKTICLAVSPSLKACGIPGRASPAPPSAPPSWRPTPPWSWPSSPRPRG